MEKEFMEKKSLEKKGIEKKQLAVLLAAMSLLLIYGCGESGQERNYMDRDSGTEAMQEAEEQEAEELPKEGGYRDGEESSNENPALETAGDFDENGASFSFADLEKCIFWFRSGVGAWATWLYIEEDGSFFGNYSDADMGWTGDGYPGGTIREGDFSGRFTQPVQINAYTYAMQIESLEYRDEIGTEEIKDGVRYCYTDAYGLEQAKDILIYLPGAPLAELPEGFRGWVGGYDIHDTSEKKLLFYALNNEAQQYGFRGEDMAEEIRERIALVEGLTASVEKAMEGQPSDVAEYVDKNSDRAQVLFDAWDYVLNDLWWYLKLTQDKDVMAALTIEEREWIVFKEQEAERAGAVYEDSEERSTAVKLKEAQLTKERVYGLAELMEME